MPGEEPTRESDGIDTPFEHITLPDRLVTGVENIDQQHRKLFAIVQRLEKLSDQSFVDVEDVLESLNLLSAYIEVHFKDEEDLMVRSHYPQIEMHTQSHNTLRRTVELFKEEFDYHRKRGNSLHPLLIRTSGFARLWIERHIMTIDVELSNFLREQKMN